MFLQTTFQKGLPPRGLVCIIAARTLNPSEGLLCIITAGRSLAAWLPEVIMHAQKNEFNENV